MTRPKLTEQLALRLDSDVITRALRLIPYWTEHSGIPSSKTDVIRAALMRGLREIEKDRARSET